jgi:FtsZ-interacting cell division protein YlmF
MTYSHNPDAIADLNQLTLRKLAKTLVSYQGRFAWIWIQCNSLPLQEQIIQDLKELCPVKWRELNLVSSVRNLYQNISQIIGHQSPSALMVTGLDSLQDIYSFFTNLNFTYGEFPKNFQFPIMIWLTDEMNQILRQYAPQLRHNSIEPFRFDGIPLPATVNQNYQPSSSIPTSKSKSNSTFEEKMQRLTRSATPPQTFSQNRIDPRKKSAQTPPKPSITEHSNSPNLPKLIISPSPEEINPPSSFSNYNNFRAKETFSFPKNERSLINQTSQILILEPNNNGEITNVIDALRAEISVLINFSKMTPEEAQRSLDFLSGGTFAVDGDQTRVGEQIFLFTPNCVKLTY